MTWANLNHTLCGIDNDPWRVAFGMHKYFYFWANVYLGLTSPFFQLHEFLGWKVVLQKLVGN